MNEQAPLTFNLSERTLEKMTDAFGPLLAKMRRLNLDYFEPFQTLEKKIAHALFLKELAAQDTGAESEAA